MKNWKSSRRNQVKVARILTDLTQVLIYAGEDVCPKRLMVAGSGGKLRPGEGASLSLSTIFTRSASESAFIFCITLPRCAFTVISLIPSLKATCLFNMPETTIAMTSRSRGVSDA